jgi:hypothetical protein
MSAVQKQAWYCLVIVCLALLTVMALAPMLGLQRAQGGFGILGFLGFTPLFFLRRRAGVVVCDERDSVIQLRSWMLAYSVFWLVFVAACMAALYKYGSSGAVPVVLVVSSPWWGLSLVFGVSSFASLVQYGWGGSDAAE